MGFFQDLFSGNFSQVGHDVTQSLKNPWEDAAIVASVALPFLAPEIGAGIGALGEGASSLLGDAGSAVSGGLGSIASDLGFGSAATGGLGAADAAAALPASSTLDALATGAGGYALPGSATALTPADLIGQDFATIGQGVSATGGAAADVAAGAPLNLAQTLGTAAGTSAGTAAGAGGGILSSITGALSPITSTLKTLAPIAGLGGLAANLYTGYEQKQALNQLNAQEQANTQNALNISSAEQSAAQPLLNSGQALTTYLQTGTLPPDFQAQVTQQVQAAKAAIIQGYAARGQNTNPQQNSALQEDLANVDLQAQSLSANLESTLATAGNQMVTTANQLLASGLNATQLASEIPIQVSQLNSSLNAQMSQAISNFAAALNGSVPNKGITLTLPQNIISSTGQANA